MNLMMEMEDFSPTFDRPIPGMGLTSEPGSRMYKNPPQYTEVEDAVEHYITRFSTEDVSQQIVHVLNMGVPVTSLVNIMTIHGVMEEQPVPQTGLMARSV